jgi:hypothetical protein
MEAASNRHNLVEKKRRAKGPPIFFLHMKTFPFFGYWVETGRTKILWWVLVKGGWGEGSMYINAWLKTIFPFFLT